MSTIRTVTETLIRKIKADIHPDTVLILPDDLFEVQRTPSVVLQGPKLSENGQRRNLSRLISRRTLKTCPMRSVLSPTES